MGIDIRNSEGCHSPTIYIFSQPLPNTVRILLYICLISPEVGSPKKRKGFKDIGEAFSLIFV